MFRRMDDFYAAYAQHVAGTLRLLGALTDESLAQSVGAGHRQLGHVAWHIVTAVPEMMKRTGLGVSAVGEHAPPPLTAAEIAAGYRAVTDEMLAGMKKGWTDSTLEQVDDMYGEQWPRGVTLAALMAHEAHHRGQLTVLMRQADLKVPGIFGPAKEEWAQYGMPAPPY
jgi:uncharacterized damage-inducible protein DinB